MPKKKHEDIDHTKDVEQSDQNETIEIELDNDDTEATEQVDQTKHMKEADLIEQLQDECSKLKDQLLRAQAEMQNYRKRVEREKNDIYRFANKKYLSDFLNVVDTIDRAKVMMIDTTDTVTVSDGIELIQKQINEFLNRQGVQSIEALDQPFDHNLHHAVLSEDSDKGEGIVLEELQKGYTLNDKILRPSMVKVSK